jgi:ABC-type multidrug transport system permease subunit
MVLTSGFTIVRGAIPPWWIWAYYISPYAYAVRVGCDESGRWDGG